MSGQFTMILGVLVWKKILPLEIAHKLSRKLSAELIPSSIEGVIEMLNKAESEKDE